ncbi:MAG TPA: glycine cleavage T C-terminal barrel domain-containing protein, partial [Acidimicrobiia bacterium]|nr:glycine cleavage T C-terminal barrel domain-containing protein [Acidimicrobiia bacterium]
DYWLMPNAANHDRVMAAFAAEPDCEVANLQGETIFLAVQGPDAPDLIERVVGAKPGRFRNTTTDSPYGEVSMAGTGYTGEPGAEICADAETGAAIMEVFVEAGATPCGLGARDTLRLEAGLPLWGEDIDESTTPLEAGLGFAVSMDHDFVGRGRLAKQQESGLVRRLSGFILTDRGIPRHGYKVRTSAGGSGEVTSGNISPMLDTGIGLAYLSPPIEPEAAIEVQVRARWVPGRTAKPPLHVS